MVRPIPLTTQFFATYPWSMAEEDPASKQWRFEEIIVKIGRPITKPHFRITWTVTLNHSIVCSPEQPGLAGGPAAQDPSQPDI